MERSLIFSNTQWMALATLPMVAVLGLSNLLLMGYVHLGWVLLGPDSLPISVQIFVGFGINFALIGFTCATWYIYGRRGLALGLKSLGSGYAIVIGLYLLSIIVGTFL